LSASHAEAQGFLGRILLEVGPLGDACLRLEGALRLDPDTRGIARDLARAYALDARWDDVDRMFSEVFRTEGPGVPFDLLRLRLGVWRGDRPRLQRIYNDVRAKERTSEPMFFTDLVDHWLRGTLTPRQGEASRVFLGSLSGASAPFRAVLAQVAAELFATDPSLDEEALGFLDMAVAAGLADKIWMDHCPCLAPLRRSPRFTTLRQVVVARAREAMRGFDDAVENLEFRG
jgi:hypothetical protein